MTRRPAGERWLAVVLPLLLGTALWAQPAGGLEALRATFERDPAAGFRQAQGLMGPLEQRGDLEGMTAIAQLALEFAKRHKYIRIPDALHVAALRVAQRQGHWQAQGDLWYGRADILRYGGGSTSTGGAMRVATLLRRASEAYERAGATPEGLAEVRDRACSLARQSYDDFVNGVEFYSQGMGPEYRQLVRVAYELMQDLQDEAAVNAMERVLERAAAEPASAQSECGLSRVISYLWLPGAERLLPQMRHLVGPEGPYGGVWPSANQLLMASCEIASMAPEDEFHQTSLWCWRLARTHGHIAWDYVTWYVSYLIARGYGEEAARRAQECHDWVLQTDYWGTDYWGGPVLKPAVQRLLLTPLLPDHTRRQIVDWDLNVSLEATLKGCGTRFTERTKEGGAWWQVLSAAPPGEKERWVRETVEALLTYAPLFPTPKDRASVASAAVRLLDEAGLAKEAEGTRQLAEQYASEDPHIGLRCALASAAWLAKQEAWAEAVQRLTTAVEKGPEGSTLVQALLLLAEGQRRLGQAEAVETALSRAQGLLERLGLPTAETARHYLVLTSLTADADRRLKCLQAGQKAALASGLDLLTDRFSERLAASALASGNLAAARTALLQTLNRLETRRDQLAFDRVLRQEWFARNLGPYRQLLTVAARTSDAPLALWVGEKMRARVLADQMAWQKVDMGVDLTAAERQELERLREERGRTYALLARVTGAAEVTGEALRGGYVPVVQTPPPAQPAAEAEIKELRLRLEALGKRESAVASAIRATVPAYAAAAAPAVPTGEAMLRALAREPGLALVQYTLAEGGLVVTACSVRQETQVTFLPLQEQALWDQVGHFRELLWERKPEAEEAGRKLYELLLQPVEGSLQGAQRLWIISDGALQLVPFGALRTGAGQYLAEKLAVATAPSLSLALSGGRHPGLGAGAVILAAPDTGAAAPPHEVAPRDLPVRGMYRRRPEDYQALRGPGPSAALTALAAIALPGAQAEGQALAAKLGATTLLQGKAATRAALLAAGQGCHLLHIATHGYADPEAPEYSGLLLAGTEGRPYDVLTAQDVYMWRLRARLVTLSACQTALGKTVQGEGLLGLTRAFLYAGAQDVLCTLWPVADDSTRTLMLAFYDRLKPDTPIEIALQQAQLSLLHTEATRAPFHWAGFTAVRGPQDAP